MRRSLAGWLLLTLAFITACGTGGAVEPSSVAALRVYNASPDSPPVDIFLRGGQVTQGLAYGFGRLYVLVNAGPGTIEVQNTNTADVLLDYDANLAQATPYTFAITGFTNSLQPVFLADDTTAAPQNNFKVRLIHLAPQGPPMDLYITDAAGDLTTATPVMTAIAYTKASTYVTAPIGNKRLQLTEAGTKTVLRDVGTFTFTSGQGVTLFLIGAAGSTGGGAPYSSQLVADHAGTS
jgi:Domain of unknown function (DUF4397)